MKMIQRALVGCACLVTFHLTIGRLILLCVIPIFCFCLDIEGNNMEVDPLAVHQWKSPICSFTKTGKKFVIQVSFPISYVSHLFTPGPQQWYNCQTCEPADKHKGCCAQCSSTCHKVFSYCSNGL